MSKKRFIKIMLLLIAAYYFSLCFGNATAQTPDTVCVTRTEMIHYASNAINLKTCNENQVILKSNLNECQVLNQHLISDLQFKNDILQLNQSIIDDQQRQLISNQKEKTRKKIWRFGFFSVTSALIVESLILFYR